MVGMNLSYSAENGLTATEGIKANQEVASEISTKDIARKHLQDIPRLRTLLSETHLNLTQLTPSMTDIWEKSRILKLLTELSNHHRQAGKGQGSQQTPQSIRCNKQPRGDKISISNALKVVNYARSISFRRFNMKNEGTGLIMGTLLKNQSILEINLSHNQINPTGAETIAIALKQNRSLQSLNLEHNQISSQGAKAIAEALKINSTLQQLNLRCNDIQDEGCGCMARAITVNLRLAVLCLAGM
eukprot:CAMPEP_0115022460 /NCGR_PEP_ID=MMETSP0216-20121206/31573_1 /TAXON_ID=223996 /ORGANISM="Protocruzia adherens, Strain Boccale" /LENGTH=243 /DNA_ID=CAMNT_0002395167 /DNA_START=9 /DNA_END=740 /DNA_ORIENTATION=+